MYKNIRSFYKKKRNQNEVIDGYSKKVIKISVIENDQQTGKIKINIFIKDNKILGTKMIEYLKDDLELTKGDFVSYWDLDKKCYVSWWQVDEIQTKDLNQNLIVDNQLKIKVRKTKKSFVQNLILQQKLPSFQYQTPSAQNRKEVPRQKQIGEIIKKVSLWRLFYIGFKSFDGQYIKEPLDSAASKTGIAKKTLDDYLLQIRTAREIGFDFNQFKNDGIGSLRSFVKSQKRSHK